MFVPVYMASKQCYSLHTISATASELSRCFTIVRQAWWAWSMAVVQVCDIMYTHVSVEYTDISCETSSCIIRAWESEFGMNKLELGHKTMFPYYTLNFQSHSKCIWAWLNTNQQWANNPLPPPTQPHPYFCFNTCLDHLLLSFLAFGCLGRGTSVLQRLNMVKVEGKFYNKTITSEWSEDRTAVLSMLKMQSELCVRTQCVSTLRTFDFKAEWTNPQTLNTPQLLEGTWKFFYFCAKPSIGQQLS